MGVDVGHKPVLPGPLWTPNSLFFGLRDRLMDVPKGAVLRWEEALGRPMEPMPCKSSCVGV